jgi:hypothetical protein
MAEEWRRGAEPPVITDFVNFSLPAGWTHAELIQEIAKRLRWRVEPLPEQLGQVSFHRGCSVFDGGKEILDKIAAEYENLYWTEKDGALRFAVIRRKRCARPIFVIRSPH